MTRQEKFEYIVRRYYDASTVEEMRQVVDIIVDIAEFVNDLNESAMDEICENLEAI